MSEGVMSSSEPLTSGPLEALEHQVQQAVGLKVELQSELRSLSGVQ